MSITCTEWAHTIYAQCVTMLVDVIEAEQSPPFGILYTVLALGSMFLILDGLIRLLRRTR